MATKTGLQTLNHKDILEVDGNPAIDGGTSANDPGSIALVNNEGSGEVWLKTGSADTDWQKILTSSDAGIGEGEFLRLAIFDAVSAGTHLDDQVVQNGQNISVKIDAQASRTEGIEYLIPNPGDDVASVSFVLTEGAQTINGDKTFGDNVIVDGDLTVNGTLTYINTTNLEVTDKLILLNKGGAAGSAGGSGLEIEEDGAVTGYLKLSSDRKGFELLASDADGALTLSASLLTAARTISAPDADGIAVLRASGSLPVAGQVTYWDNENQVVGSTGLTYDAVAQSLTVVGGITAQNGAFQVQADGALSASNGNFTVDSSGLVSAVDGAFQVQASGALSASNGNFTVDANGAVLAADGGFNILSDGSFNAASSKFVVDADGDLTKINNVSYSFPTAQAAGANYALLNDGSGVLAWGKVAITLQDAYDNSCLGGGGGGGNSGGQPSISSVSAAPDSVDPTQIQLAWSSSDVETYSIFLYNLSAMTAGVFIAVGIDNSAFVDASTIDPTAQYIIGASVDGSAPVAVSSAFSIPEGTGGSNPVITYDSYTAMMGSANFSFILQDAESYPYVGIYEASGMVPFQTLTRVADLTLTGSGAGGSTGYVALSSLDPAKSYVLGIEESLAATQPYRWTGTFQVAEGTASSAPSLPLRTAYVSSVDTRDGLYFGNSAVFSADGLTACYSAPQDMVDGNDAAGALYVTNKVSGVWSEPQRLVATTPTANVSFGGQAAISADGSTICTNAYEVVGGLNNAGAIYVFKKVGSSYGTPVRLVSPQPVADQTLGGFGMTLSADGSTLMTKVIDDVGGSGVASLVVFAKDDQGDWSGATKLTGTAPTTSFGSLAKVSSDGSRIIVCSNEEQVMPGGTSAGRAHVYQRANDGSFSLLSALTGETPEENGLFASAIVATADLSTFALVSSETVSGLQYAGKVYIYRISSGTVSAPQIITAPYPATGGNFGASDRIKLDASGTRLIIGHPSAYSGNGSVYAYNLSPSVAPDRTTVGAIGGTAESFGDQVNYGKFSADGIKFIFGAPTETVNGMSAAGRIYVLTNDNPGFSVETFTAETPAQNASFGSNISVSADGGVVLVANSGATVDGLQYAGEAYIYRRGIGMMGWTKEQTLRSASPAYNKSFASDALLSSDGLTAVCSTNNESVGMVAGAGAVYVFTRNAGGNWDRTKLTALTPSSVNVFNLYGVAQSGADVFCYTSPGNTTGVPPMFVPGKAYIATIREGGVYGSARGARGRLGAAGSAGCVASITTNSVIGDFIVAGTESFVVTAAGGMLVGSGFAVDADGETLKTNGVTYTFPASQGGSGKYLKNDGSGNLAWDDAMAIGHAVVDGTSGSMLFVDASGNLAQDNTHLFWDAANKRLGIGNDEPAATLDVSGNVVVRGSLRQADATAAMANWERRQTQISTTNAVPGNAVQLDIPDNSVVMLRAYVLARRTGGTSGAALDSGVYIRTARIKKVNGVVSLHAMQTDYTSEDQRGWSAVIEPTSDQDVHVFVTGAEGNDIDWTVNYEFIVLQDASGDGGGNSGGQVASITLSGATAMGSNASLSWTTQNASSYPFVALFEASGMAPTLSFSKVQQVNTSLSGAGSVPLSSIDPTKSYVLGLQALEADIYPSYTTDTFQVAEGTSGVPILTYVSTSQNGSNQDFNWSSANAAGLYVGLRKQGSPGMFGNPIMLGDVALGTASVGIADLTDLADYKLQLYSDSAGVTALGYSSSVFNVDFTIPATLTYTANSASGSDQVITWTAANAIGLYVGLEKYLTGPATWDSPIMLGTESDGSEAVAQSLLTNGDTYRLQLYSDSAGTTVVSNTATSGFTVSWSI